MKTGKPTNMAASVRARLLNLSKVSGEDFTYVLTRYALERLLARLERSKYRPGERWPELRKRLTNLRERLEKQTKGPALALPAFRDWAPRVARFSFQAGRVASFMPDDEPGDGTDTDARA